MDLGLNNKVALVMGAGGGLGGAIARALAAEGAKVVVAGRNIEGLTETVASIETAGGTAMARVWDLTALDTIDGHVAAIEAEYGGVDVLINNSGGPPPTTAHGQPADLWLRNFQSMVLSVIAITDRVLPGMRDRRWGRIITSTSSGVPFLYQMRTAERAAAQSRRVVEDASTRGWQRWYHGEHRAAGTDCHAAHPFPRQSESGAREPCRRRRQGREHSRHPTRPLR